MDKFKYALIQQRREKLNLTQFDLAYEMCRLGTDVTPSTIHSWENGTTSPDADKVPGLAKALQIPVEDFYA